MSSDPPLAPSKPGISFAIELFDEVLVAVDSLSSSFVFARRWYFAWALPFLKLF